MDIGTALPSMVDEVTGADLTTWARAAESYGFSTLSVLDRLVCGGTEPLVSLAVAAGATERIRLATSVLIAACRGDTALLAKQTASLHRLSGGRLTLGVAAGIRPDDFERSGTGYHDRGRRLDATLAELRRIWREGEIGPSPGERPPSVMVGGRSDAALVRMARHGDGAVIVAPPAAFAQRARKAEEVWTAHGRPGRPRLVAQTYFSLGPRAVEEAREHLGAYYAFGGVPVEQFVQATPTSPEQVREAVAGYRRAGCDEVVFVPCSAHMRQLEMLAAEVKETW
ncbi:LLM class flavin-dependent oxidoreductase [Streptomyces sp. NPDC053542]|uniref:LLM class flavin-dependent oxidoreductase n=1 Tax=Streptomyces sp. NPDC053542 TaxID=3365710 RepID=UPI0037D39B38